MSSQDEHQMTELVAISRPLDLIATSSSSSSSSSFSDDLLFSVVSAIFQPVSNKMMRRLSIEDILIELEEDNYSTAIDKKDGQDKYLSDEELTILYPASLKSIGRKVEERVEERVEDVDNHSEESFNRAEKERNKIHISDSTSPVIEFDQEFLAVYKERFFTLFKKKPKGLVLSGSGIRGIMQAGGLYYLENLGLLSDVDYYCSTSAGGLISYLLSIGYSTIEIFSYVNTNDLSAGLDKISLLGLLTTFGVYSYETIQTHMTNLTLDKFGFIPSLEELYHKTKKTLIFTTVNRTKKKIEYISHLNYPELSIIKALRMTSNIPIVFDRCCYNGDVYLDGGIGDDFPARYLDNLLPPGENIVGLLLKQRMEAEDQTIIQYVNSIIQIIPMIHDEQTVHHCSSRFHTIIMDTETGNAFNLKADPKTKIKYFLLGHQIVQKLFEKDKVTVEEKCEKGGKEESKKMGR